MITGKDLIEKMYSDNYSEYEDTRLYSTGDDYLDELLERAFSEGYEYAQREFARRDYEGLSETQKTALLAKRSDYAKQLRLNHNDVVRNAKEGIMGSKWDHIISRGKIRAGGVESNWRQESHRGSNSSRKDFNDFHRNSMLTNLLATSGHAKKIMKNDVLGGKPMQCSSHFTNN